jgi:secreted Zn-dependent insulinase-like peptidase
VLREPLFDDLRTKQQLGYIVSAYYEIGYSSRGNDQSQLGPLTIPVDFITINILSRKMSPPDVSNRIEEFLTTFRESLLTMPESEIRDHADALSTTLLKPIQKLQTEANDHFGRIQRYGPEIFHHQQQQENGSSGSNPEDRLPWDSKEALARSIQSLSRSDLLETWDRMTHPSSRSRVVSCVYGNTFPLDVAPATTGITTTSKWNVQQRSKVVNSFPALIQLRKRLEVFDDQPTTRKRRYHWNPLVRLGSSQSSSRVLNMFGIGCMLGVGVVGLTMVIRNQKMKTWKR